MNEEERKKNKYARLRSDPVRWARALERIRDHKRAKRALQPKKVRPKKPPLSQEEKKARWAMAYRRYMDRLRLDPVRWDRYQGRNRARHQWKEERSQRPPKPERIIRAKPDASVKVRFSFDVVAMIEGSFSKRNEIKTAGAEAILGCSLSNLRTMISPLMADGMTWEGYGVTWRLAYAIDAPHMDAMEVNRADNLVPAPDHPHHADDR